MNPFIMSGDAQPEEARDLIQKETDREGPIPSESIVNE
jgi:hypothetical protein